MAPTTPTGSWTTSELPISSSHSKVSAALRGVGEGAGRQADLDGARQRHRHADLVADDLWRSRRCAPPGPRRCASAACRAPRARWRPSPGRRPPRPGRPCRRPRRVPSGMVAKTSSVAESMTSSVPLPGRGDPGPVDVDLVADRSMGCLPGSVPLRRAVPTLLEARGGAACRDRPGGARPAGADPRAQVRPQPFLPSRGWSPMPTGWRCWPEHLVEVVGHLLGRPAALAPHRGDLPGRLEQRVGEARCARGPGR